MKQLAPLLSLTPILLFLTGCQDPAAQQHLSELNASLTSLQAEKDAMQAQIEPLQEEIAELKAALKVAEAEVAQHGEELAAAAELEAYVDQVAAYAEAERAGFEEDLERMRQAYEARCKDVGRKQPSLEVALRKYKNVTFRQFSETGIVVDHDEGLLNAPYNKLPADLQKRYVYELREPALMPTRGKSEPGNPNPEEASAQEVDS